MAPFLLIPGIYYPVFWIPEKGRIKSKDCHYNDDGLTSITLI